MNKHLSNLLLETGFIDIQSLELVEKKQEESGESLTRCLVELKHADESEILEFYSKHFNLPIHDFGEDDLDADLLKSVPVEIVQNYRCVPVCRQNGSLTLAVSEPPDSDLLDLVRFACGCHVETVLSPEKDIVDTIQKHYDITVAKILEDLSPDPDEATDEYFIHDLQEQASEPTLINLVNLIISQAIHDGASDIHIEPFEDEMKVKYRIDGILREIAPPPKHLQAAIISRVKIMAGMDIAKRHEPQDGHIRINLPHAQVDVRVSTIPTIFGESAVLRLLNKSAALLTLPELGLSESTYKRYERLLDCTYGIILVCGPTGCGKTTTLYTSLNKIFTPEKKFITIEDPVEYQLNGINQIPVRPARGLTFAGGLRSVLRHDPDILMVGEIRDLETAQIAIRSALTGHLVFSTLHTNDAASAVTRLLDMGVEPFLTASSLQGILAQRLVRRLCPECREPMTPNAAELSQFGRTQADIENITFYNGKGCESCNNWGYSGRVAVAELLIMTDALQNAILNNESSHVIKAIATKNMETMREDGWRKICQGVTSFDSVLKQTQIDKIESENADS